MIEATFKDIGRKVSYTRSTNNPRNQTEYGIISSINEYVVFVRFGNDKLGQAMLRSDLEYVWKSCWQSFILC